MDINELASIANIVEAIAVIISIGFIWRQIKESNAITKMDLNDRVMDTALRFNTSVLGNRELAELFVRGKQRFEEFDDVDKERYLAILSGWTMVHENVFFQAKHQFMRASSYEAWQRDLETFIDYHQLWQHWPQLKIFLNSKFVVEVTPIIEKLKSKHEISTSN